jgi:hypothetical protein
MPRRRAFSCRLSRIVVSLSLLVACGRVSAQQTSTTGGKATRGLPDAQYEHSSHRDG